MLQGAWHLADRQQPGLKRGLQDCGSPALVTLLAGPLPDRSSGPVLLVLKQGFKQLIVGLSAGLVLAGALSVPMADIFYRVEPWDGSIFALIAVILTGTGLLAIFLPARRATRVDPLEALRTE